MSAMMRFCPNCKTERAVGEWFCEGVFDGHPCNWDLSGLPIRESGWRPHEIVTADAAGPHDDAPSRQASAPSGARCANGHPMDEGDLICLECGAGPATDTDRVANALDGGPRDARETGLPSSAGETRIDGWGLVRQISSTDGVRDRYIAHHCNTGRQAVLTLYRPGMEPDPSVYDVVRRLPREHVPEIIVTGRWDGRAYEVAEELGGGTLADLGIAIRDMPTLRRVAEEMGRALHAFSEAGLRHRDLRPGTLLVRNRDPLDLVISGFGSARLSEFDLDIVAPLETTRYMAPEAIAGGVAAASDWWSLGMILLEQLTEGRCFEGVNPRAFLIHALASGVSLPDDLDPSARLLLRGLLARDRHRRWQWPQVQAWLAGEYVDAPSEAASETNAGEGAGIALGGRQYRKPAVFALDAAEREHWEEARDHLARGVIATWAEQAGLPPRTLASLRQAAMLEETDDDCRLMIALRLLNPEMPLILRGDIVTPGWLLQNPLEGYDLIAGPVPAFLEKLDAGAWLSRLRSRAEAVRRRARRFDVALDENTVRIGLLSTSRARLAEQWEEKRLLLPDSPHPGLLALMERRILGEEDLILLLGAAVSQFRPVDEILERAAKAAAEARAPAFDRETARAELALPRMELFRRIDERIAGFARAGNETLDAWADRFRQKRRLPLHEALVLLAVPPERWLEPQKQQYVSQILDFFEKKVATAVMRGPLVRMRLSRTAGRIDLHQFGSDRRPAAALLEHLIQRNSRAMPVAPEVFDADETLEPRLNALYRQTSLYRRDTGIDSLYLGFPFLLCRDGRARIAPVLLWPVRLLMEPGARRRLALAFDGEREEIRLNPALEGLLGREDLKNWRTAADEALGRSSLAIADVMDAFGMLADADGRQLVPLPPPDTAIAAGQPRLSCAGVLFHAAFTGQALGEDLRQLRSLSPAHTALEAMLRLRDENDDAANALPDGEIGRFLTAASDPSQEEAVRQARRGPGLLVEGPPGTGKSQTIVNMVADAIGRGKSLLIVCQKHAALEVVHKRLVAEGLGDRIVMVNDVNRDREPVIRALRAQLDAVFQGPAFDDGRIRRRERTAARIEALEGEIDRRHEALYRVDAASGLSYRALLGEIIELESGAPPIDMPLLRGRLAALDAAMLATLEEECAPLARHWLPARFEDSALVRLQPFAADPATVEEFTALFAAFREAERQRIDTLAAHPARFDIDDPAPCKAWLDANAGRLRALDDARRRHLVRWLPLFRSAGQENAEEGGDAPGHRYCAALEALHRELCVIDDGAFDPHLSPALARATDEALLKIEARAVLAARPPTFFSRLNPAAWFRRGVLLKFATASGVPADGGVLPRLLAAARLERQWRPARRRLQDVGLALGLETDRPGAPDMDYFTPQAWDCGPALAGECLARLRQLEEIRELARHLASAPRGGEFEMAALTGKLAPIERLLDEFQTAFVRHAARQRSLDALAPLAGGFDDALLDTCRQAIHDHLDSRPALDRIHDALPTLAAYQRFRARAKHLHPESLALLALMRQYESVLTGVSAGELEQAVRRLIGRETRLGWKRRIEQGNPELLLEQAETSARIAALAAADEEMRRLNRALLREGITRSRLGPSRAWEDITRLTGRRSRRLREFVELGAGLGLMALRPVWLMNPDVASRLLPLKPGFFDTVIYDEASQMPVEYALPTLFRGRIAIVSGDEKQMPPTAFFSSRASDDETETDGGDSLDEDASDEEREQFEDDWNRREIKDCPDLLQLARTVLPVRTLQIHYRSAYRELIGYSNAAFYGNGLDVPARHPDATIRMARPLELIRADGFYEQQTNPGEAGRVVEYLAALWREPRERRPSTGVVTFNRKQADLIEERLALRAEEDPDFRDAYREERDRIDGGEDMGVFVKNVENVQGDERDVIVFSTTFGRNRQGAFRRAFGALGQQGGERRLNVATTRARRKVVLVTSMPIRDISDMLDTQRRPAVPRDHLQAYMEYARMMSAGELPAARALLERVGGERGRSAAGPAGGDDGLARKVLAYIRELGFAPAIVREGGVFGFDFAITDPATGLYAIGIECDAPRHRLLQRARAREIWRPSVLKRALPSLHRVSSRAWYHEPETEKMRLKAAIEAALGRDKEVKT